MRRSPSRRSPRRRWWCGRTAPAGPWRQAVLRLEDGRWVLADNGSTNGIYAGGRRVDRVEIDDDCAVRLSHPADGPVLSCTVTSVTTLRIGRAPDNDLVLSDPSVSSHHAELRRGAGRYRIVDLDSRNGTYVNERCVAAAPVTEGDLVGFGSATFRLVGRELLEVASSGLQAGKAPPTAAAPPPPGDGLLEIRYAVRWLVPRGERFANFHI